MNYGVRLPAATGDELFTAGSFTTAGGKISPYMARVRIGSKAQGLTASNSTPSIRFSGVTGYPYDVQRANNLTPPVAGTTVSAAPLYPAPDGSFTFTDSNTPLGKAFYRAGPGPAACPKLGLQQPAGTNLTNGISTIGFGAVAVGSSVSKTFTITNSGTDALSIAEVYAEDEFAVDWNGMFSMVPGDSTTFTVTFSPAVAGNHAAQLYVSTFGVEGCNDGEGDWFTIILTGTGL
ncbi:MAG TPA: choice-of-anchor D domain-containing protein [Pyrinomonadaceae bacterium]